jgi:ribosome-associated toxin RatA of RatAB toxin-antitoxin module
MATENNKNIKYNDKFHFKNRIKKITDTNVKNVLSTMINTFTNVVKAKHS